MRSGPALSHATTAPDAVPDAAHVPPLPGWAMSAGAADRGQTLEEAAFFSGAALSHLHAVLARPEVPLAVLTARLALQAAEACVIRSGRPERAGDLRDAVCFLRPGDLPGPAGAVWLDWQAALRRPVLAQGPGGAVMARVSAAIETHLQAHPQDAVGALIRGDAALAQGVGWRRLVPLLGQGFGPRDLHRTGDALRLACHRAVVRSAQGAVGLAADLARRGQHLQAAASGLRARGAPAAVALFLSGDVLAPGALAPALPARAARRLCERLIGLGALREMTGRATFRLYGL